MFTPQVDKKLKMTIMGVLTVVGVAFISGYFGFHNRVTDVGYRPIQPVPYSHALHAGELGIKCMYCHTGVEESASATVPPTSTCMNCHVAVGTDKPSLDLVRESAETGAAIEWRRVHKLPDYVNFNHSRHIRVGIDCASCHGEVEKMGVVTQMEPFNMGMCLDCHRNPSDHVIPAREISGIFMGDVSEEELAEMWQNPTEGGGNWIPVMEGEIEAIADPHHEFMMDEPAAPGMFVPKKPSKGPETCSACHF